MDQVFGDAKTKGSSAAGTDGVDEKQKDTNSEEEKSVEQRQVWCISGDLWYDPLLNFALEFRFQEAVLEHRFPEDEVFGLWDHSVFSRSYVYISEICVRS